MPDRQQLVKRQRVLADFSDFALRSQLHVRSYVTRLVENLCAMHEEQSGKVRLEFAIEDVELGPNIAVPLGLILTEFVTNSFKYAFDGQGGAISVCIQTLEGSTVGVPPDNGRGLPPNLAPRRPGRAPG